MNSIQVLSSNSVQVALCREVMSRGGEVNPREMKTRELLGVSFELQNPRNRLTTLRGRNWSGALAVAEFLWHLRGDTSVDALSFYTPKWKDFADSDGMVRGSCYGARIFSAKDRCRSQWDSVKALLRNDISSRRAILSLMREVDVSEETNDLSCTSTLQFIVRENKLHAFVSMRSNDVIWGVPYDLFLFTSLQELMALELGLEVGRYFHSAASMHIYEKHYELAEVIGRSDQSAIDSGSMPCMTSMSDVRMLADDEISLRRHGVRRHKKDYRGFEASCLTLLNGHRKIKAIAA
ncbi:thymidylate synthase [Lysobacter capsici]|uniref:thymidylate synthase n=1 Tax=Lysobacter capsici TaxID=435897 RepID=UPI000A8421EA|nr:thymidylate synthase [Lysobacter capsici]